MSENKHIDYLVGRIRQLSTSTGNWALLFLLALLYTWISSIYPRAVVIENYQTSLKEQKHFESLVAQLKIQRRSKVDTLNLKKARLEDALSDTSLVNVFEKISVVLDKSKKDPGRLYMIVDSLSKLTGRKRQIGFENIKSDYLPQDIMIAMAELQKNKAKQQRDSLLNKTAVRFDIPGVKELNFGFRAGLLMWMFLTFVLLLYLFTVRKRIIDHLKVLYQSMPAANTNTTFNRMYLQLPFWLAPLQIQVGPQAPVFKELVARRNTGLSVILLWAPLLTLLLMQVYVAWLGWHVSIINGMESSFFKVAYLTVLVSTVVLLLIWRQPVSYESSFTNSTGFSVKRRELLKLAGASILFCFLLPPVAARVPLMQGNKLAFKRSRKKANGSKNFIALPDGLYLHTRASKATLHFIQNKKCTTFFNVKTSNPALKEKLKPVSLEALLNSEAALSYRIPRWSNVFEEIAYGYAINNNYEMAIRVMLFSLRYALANGISLYYGTGLVENGQTEKKNSQPAHTSTKAGGTVKRTKDFLCGLIIRARHLLTADEFQKIDRQLAQALRNMNSAVLNEQVLEQYRSRKNFSKRWQSSAHLPWLL